MAGSPDPYDELPYRSLPVEWTAPERLALVSLLHGGPRSPLDGYRVLELGCGDGANLLPLAYYRRHAEFVGVDGAGAAIESAAARGAGLGLSNLSFVHADFAGAGARLSGKFDFIIAHGVVSWVPDEVRDALLVLCARRLRPGGLVYLNYNTRPGWTVRGMVRDYLLAETAGTTGLENRARLAQDCAARIAASLATDSPHPYVRLIANEFRLVADKHLSYIAHEYLATHNRPYWRCEFLDLVRRHGFKHVSDADFNYESGRLPEGLAGLLRDGNIAGRDPDQTIDLLCYRQMHSPILTQAPLDRSPPSPEELAALTVASCLVPCAGDDGGATTIQHPSGRRVEVPEPANQRALAKLRTVWPRGLPVREAFAEPDGVIDLLLHLQREGLVELRRVEPGDFGVDGGPLNALEAAAGYITTCYHTCEAVS